MTLQELNVVIRAETSGLRKALKGAEDNVDKFGKSVSGINKAFDEMAKRAQASMSKVSDSVSQAAKSMEGFLTSGGKNNKQYEPWWLDVNEVRGKVNAVKQELKDLEEAYKKNPNDNSLLFAISNKQEQRQNLANQLQGIYNKSGTWTTEYLENLKVKLAEAQKELNGYRNQFKDIKVLTDSNTGKKGFFNQKNEWVDLTEKTKGYNDALRRVIELQAQVNEGMNEANSTNLSNWMNIASFKFSEFFKQFSNVKFKDLEKSFSNIKDTIATGEGADKWVSVASQVVSLLVKAYNWASAISDKLTGKVLPYVKLAGEYIANWTTSLGKVMIRLNPIGNFVKGLSKSLKSLWTRVKRVLVYSTIVNWFRTMRTEFANFLKTEKELGLSIGNLKGSFLTAFKPIYDIVIPALTTAVNWINQFILRLGALIALLTGTNITANQKSAKALYNQAKALSGVGSAAKEAKKQLASFDELDILHENDTSGSGGVDWGATTFGDLGDLKQYKSWGEWFSDWLDRCIAWLPTFHSWMLKAAEAINAFNRNLYDMFHYIDENGISVQDKVSTLAKGLADGFNLLVEKIDWSLMGHALGAGINTALNFLNNFIERFSWYNLGSSIAKGINGAIAEIKWKDVGSFLVQGWNIIWQTFNGFVQKLNWKDLSYSISTAIKTAIEKIDLKSATQAISKAATGILELFNTIISTIEWDEVGKKIGQALAEVDWATIISNLMTLKAKLIKALWEVISNAVKEINWGEIAKGLWDGFITGIALKLLTMWEQIKTVFWTVVTFVKNIFGIHSPSTVFQEIGGNLVEGLYNGISLSNIWTNLWSFLTNKLQEIKDLCHNTWENIKNDASTVWTNIKTFIETTITTLKTNAENLFTTFKTNLTNTTNQLKDALINAWNLTKQGIKSALDNIKTNFTTAWSNIVSDTKSKFETLVSNIGSAVSRIGSSVSSMLSTISSGISSAWSSISSFVSSAVSRLASVRIPHFANGGVLNSPTIGLMGEYAGARTNPEIITPESKMREVFNEGNQEMLDMMGQMIGIMTDILEKDNSITIGDDVISASAARGNRNYKLRTGRSQFAI